MKKKNLWIIAFVAIITIGIFGCGGDDTPTHTHEWQWVVTQEGSATEERIETETCKTCGETRGTRAIPIARETTITITLDTSTTATVKGTLTLADITAFSEKLTTAINNGYKFDHGDDFDNGDYNAWFNMVFNSTSGKKATIIVENNVSYTSYQTDNRITMRFNSDYLRTVNSNDLQEMLFDVVDDMKYKPLPTD